MYLIQTNFGQYCIYIGYELQNLTIIPSYYSACGRSVMSGFEAVKPFHTLGGILGSSQSSISITQVSVQDGNMIHPWMLVGLDPDAQ